MLRPVVELRLDRKIRQRVDASDILQDVLIEAARRLRKVDFRIESVSQDAIATLDNGQVPPIVAETFQEQDMPLSRQAAVQVEQRGTHWRIKDEDVTFIVTKQGQRLDISLSGMPLGPWLRQMAQDRIIDAHRRHRSSGKRSVDREQLMTAPGGSDRSTAELQGFLPDKYRTPAEDYLIKEEVGRCKAAIEQLDEQDREIINLRYVKQLSNQEVAQALNLTDPAASMRFLRATRRLRKLLQEASED
jgi:RNA polymerase sigma-70 factor (ECF subfamily)